MALIQLQRQEQEISEEKKLPTQNKTKKEKPIVILEMMLPIFHQIQMKKKRDPILGNNSGNNEHIAYKGMTTKAP